VNEGEKNLSEKDNNKTSHVQVTLRRVHPPIVIVEKAISFKYSECVSVAFRYAVYNAHTPYCYLWPAPLYNIFSTLSHKGTIFEKKIIEHKLLSEMFLILRRNE
jgi:hypothetical protein